jgi:hypothetical protein
VVGLNGNCNIPADASAVAMNVTAVGGTAGSFLTIWPSDVAPRPLASNLNWVPGSPPTPNKVDVKLSADGKINLFNLQGSVSVLADVVGYYADHNHDDRYARRVSVDYNLANGAVSAAIEIPPNIPVTVTGTQINTGFRGVGTAVLLSIPGNFLEWTGLESTNGSVITQGFDSVAGTHILYIDFLHSVDVEVATPTSIQIHNSSGVPASGTVTLTW